ncbi:hydrolase 2, exosortase A system-associated [Pseudoduganella violaceinigra]|uniref:hydrolase 2, exosortase A system-associated n=1 Tax=Pseudoduganella violaceinigra TaxID=246602 RepID=UPI0003F8B4E9|nr:hydrolase 2, exosortase A system-associated [Pseudoduganella violaceinigra]
MMPAPAQPLFIGQGGAARFGLYHAPAGPCRGAWLYLHPWAEEMNKARRMAALQARALAAAGWAVLQLDLHGCGDSAGDFGDAGWDSWRADVARGLDWLHNTVGSQLPQAPGLWGLRLGALLALDYAAQPAGRAPARLLLWQPVLQGATHLTQFLRLRVAAQMLGEGGGESGTADLRATLAGGTPLEIAGYTLAPAMAAALDQLDAARLAPPCPVHWLEVVAADGRPLPPAAQRLLQAWQAAGADCRVQTVAGPQFWATQEIAEAPALLEATRTVLLEACHA